MRKVQESERRQQILVGGSYQRGLVLRLARTPLIVLVLLACLAIVVLPMLEPGALTSSVVLGIAFGIGALLVISSTIRASARISGAELALRRSLERIRGGDWAQRVRLRHRDELKQLSYDLNALLDWLETHPPRARTDDEGEKGHRDVG